LVFCGSVVKMEATRSGPGLALGLAPVPGRRLSCRPLKGFLGEVAAVINDSA
jgi:hypothetical protein